MRGGVKAWVVMAAICQHCLHSLVFATLPRGDPDLRGQAGTGVELVVLCLACLAMSNQLRLEGVGAFGSPLDDALRFGSTETILEQPKGKTVGWLS